MYYKISGERRRGKDGIKNRARRQRKSYEQIKILRRSFAENEYPNRQEKQALADQLGLTYEQTHVIDYITRIFSLLSHDSKIMRTSRILKQKWFKSQRETRKLQKNGPIRYKNGAGQFLAKTDFQLDELEEAFETNCYPSTMEMELLAEKIGLRLKSIKVRIFIIQHLFICVELNTLNGPIQSPVPSLFWFKLSLSGEGG